jgi:hypothetical protein
MWRASAGMRRPPGYIEPCIPTRVSKPPVGPQWVHEIKHDGYRLMVWRDGERVRLFTRRGFDWSERYPWIADSARRLPVTQFLIDGEAVICGEDGVSDFDRLHSRQHDGSVFLYAFDLLALDGADIRHEQLDHRRDLLGKLLGQPDGIRFSEHLDGDGGLNPARAKVVTDSSGTVAQLHEFGHGVRLLFYRQPDRHVVDGFLLGENEITAEPAGVNEDGEEVIQVEERFGSSDPALRGSSPIVEGFRPAKGWFPNVMKALAESLPAAPDGDGARLQ